MSRFQNGLLSIYRGFTYFVELLNGCFWTLKDKDLFFLHAFLTILTVVTILAKFGTKWKMSNASLLWSCVALLFWVFRIFWGLLWYLWTWTCVELSLLQVTVFYYKQAICIELSKFWCEALTIVLGCMRMSFYVSGAQLAGWRGRRSPLPFLKIEKLDLV